MSSTEKHSRVSQFLRRWYWLFAILGALIIWLAVALAMRPLRDSDGSFASYPYGLMTDLENKAVDLLFQTRDARHQDLRSRGLREPLTIIEIDEESIKASKVRLQKWPRDWYARLIDRASEGGAAVIGVDTFFSEEGGVSSEDKAADKKLAESIANAGNVVLAMKSASGGSPEIKTLSIFSEGAYAVGFVDLPLDKDGFVRSPQLFLAQPGQEAQLSFASRLAEGYLAANMPEGTSPPALQLVSEKTVKLADRILRLRNDLNLQLDYRSRSPAFRRISAAESLFEDPSTVPTDLFRDRIVLIGASNIDAPDLFPTPFYETMALTHLISRNLPTAPQRTPGVELHATATATIVFGNVLTRPRYGWQI